MLEVGFHNSLRHFFKQRSMGASTLFSIFLIQSGSQDTQTLKDEKGLNQRSHGLALI